MTLSQKWHYVTRINQQFLDVSADWFSFVTFVETGHLHADVYKSELSQSEESRAQSADCSKANFKAKACNSLAQVF